MTSPDSPDDQSTQQPIYEPPDLERPASASPTEAELEEQTPVSIRLGSHDPYAALRHRDYLLYSVGSLIAAIGNQMQGVAVGWEIYDRTRDPLALGLVGLVQALPVLLFALPAGQLADRFDRRRIVLAMQLLVVLSWFGLAYISYTSGPIWMLYGCLLLDGIGHSFAGPAQSSLMPQLVPPELLSNAITWNSSRWQIGSMVGPALGGFAIAWLGGTWMVYLVSAVCVLVLVVFILPLRPRPQQRAGEPMSLASLLMGFRFVWNTKLLLATLTLDMFAVLLGGAVALLPVFASEDYLNVGPEGLGWLRAAPAVGALVMALLIAHLPPMRRAGKALLWAVAGFGAATIVFGLTPALQVWEPAARFDTVFTVLEYSGFFWLAMLMLFLTGALDNISVVVRHTLVQALTPDQMRGRVSAVNSVFIGTSNEIGAFESGVIAAWIGPIAAVVAGGFGTILVVLGVARIWPQITALGTLEEASRGALDA